MTLAGAMTLSLAIEDDGPFPARVLAIFRGADASAFGRNGSDGTPSGARLGAEPEGARNSYSYD